MLVCVTVVNHRVFDDVSVFLAQCAEVQTDTGTLALVRHAAVRTH